MIKNIKIVAVLTFTCLLCAFLLSLVNILARDETEKNQRREIEEAIFNLSPLTKRIEKFILDNDNVYRLLDQDNKLVGYGFIAQGNGYQGTIKILVVANQSLDELEGIEIIESSETPGLGGRIKEGLFKDQFKKLKVQPQIECIKDGTKKANQIQSITSATISSKAVVNIVNQKIKEIRDNINNESK
ncbi:MAG: FMN-binding protein [Candidatus Omnitrophica bacterium]|nr:FMN-binding protein [Candidatus Omnitrophota bacterium]MCM8826010.1 FMN-binding protein [Candidatus Omnitrophota bacterium]